MDVPASPSRLPGHQGLSNNSLTDAVTTSVLHRQQVEDEAVASSSHGQEGKLSGRQTLAEKQHPGKTGCPASEKSAGNDPVGAGARRGQNTIASVETHTWEEMEGAVWQGARGTVDGTMGYALTVLDQMRTDVEERFRAQTRALQAGRQEGEEFGRNPQRQDLMGRTRYLWERNIDLQLQVRALTEEREDLVRSQTADLETTLGLQNEVAELKQERDQLQQQLAGLRAEPSATATTSASVASEVRRTAQEWKVTADRLKADAYRIRAERGQLQNQLKELQAAYQQKTEDLIPANGTIDIFQEQIKHLRQTAQPVSPASQAFVTPTGGGLPTHR